MKLKNIFKLPTPVELGISESNALPSRKWTPGCDGITWEDYDKILEANYPFKYKMYSIVDAIVLWFSVHVTMQISQFWYWIVSHTVRKYHFLDLRQPKSKSWTQDDYRWGYRDTSDRMVYANFNLLKEYVDGLEPNRWTEEDLQDPATVKQHFYEIEAREILYWWEVYRKEDYEQYWADLHEWSELRHGTDKAKEEMLFNDLRIFEQDLDNDLDNMLIRLVKIRKGMWS